MPENEGGPILIGDNASTVSLVNRCGGSRDARTGLVTRVLETLELTSIWLMHISETRTGSRYRAG